MLGLVEFQLLLRECSFGGIDDSSHEGVVVSSVKLLCWKAACFCSKCDKCDACLSPFVSLSGEILRRVDIAALLESQNVSAPSLPCHLSRTASKRDTAI